MFTALSIVVYYAKFIVVTNDPRFETRSEKCSTGRQVNLHLEELIINLGLQAKGMILERWGGCGLLVVAVLK